eukprot:6484732-Amphidinium_carterae.1
MTSRTYVAIFTSAVEEVPTAETLLCAQFRLNCVFVQEPNQLISCILLSMGERSPCVETQSGEANMGGPDVHKPP